jgi:phage-related minor tail protein
VASNVVTVTLVGDATKLNKAFKESGGQAKTWGDKMSSAGSTMTVGLTAPIVAGAALAVDAAAEEQQEMEKLAGSIEKNIPGATEKMIAANEDWITSMQNATGVADSDIRNSIQQLVQAGVPLEEAQKQTAAAMDIAAAKGVDLAKVTNAQVKAYNGNTTALGRLVGQTKDASGEALTLDQIMQNAADTMGGSAATAADTAAGRAEIMKLKMGDLAESIGSVLLPLMEQLVEWASKVADWFNNLSPTGKKLIVMIAGVAAAIGPVLLVGAKLVKAFGAISKAFGIVSKLMATNPWLLLIAAVVALVIIIVKNWDKITAFLKRTWDWIKTTAGKLWEWIKEVFKAALDWLVKLFLNWTLAGLLIKHWDKIKEGIRNVVQWIKDTWDGVVDWFKNLPGRITNAIGDLWGGLKTAFRNAINWVIDRWNDFKIQIKLPGILGGSTISLDTPNIPRFHQGGVFRAPTSGGEGLAILKDRERVLPAGGRASGGTIIFAPVIHAGVGTDPNALARAVLEALQTYQRINGPLALDVRMN